MLMNLIKLVVDIALAIIPGIALKGKKNLESELEIAQKTIQYLTSDMPSDKKAFLLKNAVNSLKAVKNFKKGFCNRIDKAEIRLFKKFF